MKTLKFQQIKQLPKITKLECDNFWGLVLVGEGRKKSGKGIRKDKNGLETVNSVLPGEMKQQKGDKYLKAKQVLSTGVNGSSHVSVDI